MRVDAFENVEEAIAFGNDEPGEDVLDVDGDVHRGDLRAEFQERQRIGQRERFGAHAYVILNEREGERSVMRISVDVTVLGRLSGDLGAVDPVALIAR